MAYRSKVKKNNKTLTANQLKIASVAGDPKKIEKADFKKLKQNKKKV
jgi:hypothetical protein